MFFERAQDRRAQARPELPREKLPKDVPKLRKWFAGAIAQVAADFGQEQALAALEFAWDTYLGQAFGQRSGWAFWVFATDAVWPSRLPARPVPQQAPTPCVVCGSPSTGEVWGRAVCDEDRVSWQRFTDEAKAARGGAIADWGALGEAFFARAAPAEARSA